MKYVYSPWIFEDLKKWEGLTDKKYLINLKKRAVIYEQDDEVSYLYILKKGRVRLLYLAPDGTEHVMLFVLPGGIFGECECIEKRQSLFRAEALSDISLYKVPRFAVLETLKERKMSLLVMKNMMKKSVCWRLSLLVCQWMIRKSALQERCFVRQILLVVSIMEFSESNLRLRSRISQIWFILQGLRLGTS